VTLTDLHGLLCLLRVGEPCELPYDVYELLFPPGEPDSAARASAFQFAQDHGCEIDNQPQNQRLVFTKRITNPPCCVNPVQH
jgi:hypothetical protein